LTWVKNQHNTRLNSIKFGQKISPRPCYSADIRPGETGFTLLQCGIIRQQLFHKRSKAELRDRTMSGAMDQSVRASQRNWGEKR